MTPNRKPKLSPSAAAAKRKTIVKSRTTVSKSKPAKFSNRLIYPWFSINEKGDSGGP